MLIIICVNQVKIRTNKRVNPFLQPLYKLCIIEVSITELTMLYVKRFTSKLVLPIHMSVTHTDNMLSSTLEINFLVLEWQTFLRFD